MRAWWEGEVIDRPVVLVKAPKEGMSRAEWDAIQSPEGVAADDIVDWFTNAERVVERQNRYVDATFWGGEAFPVTFPVATRMVAITAAYVGCPYTLDPVSHTGWAAPVIDGWDGRAPDRVRPGQRVVADLAQAARRVGAAGEGPSLRRHARPE